MLCLRCGASALRMPANRCLPTWMCTSPQGSLPRSWAQPVAAKHLLKLMLGLLPCTQGSVQRLPQVTMGYVPQRAMIDWRFPVTAEQVVLMGRYRHTSSWPWATRADRREVGALLDRLGLTPYARRHISQLSGGQQQRIFLALRFGPDPSSCCSMNPPLAWT